MNFIKALGTVAFFTITVTGCSTSNEYLDLSNPVRVGSSTVDLFRK